jgi:hypothetical protein
VLDRTLPDETRADFGAGGYAYDAQDDALRSLSILDLLAALRRIRCPPGSSTVSSTSCA